MKILSIFAFALILSSQSFGQITAKNWLLGGDFMYSKTSYENNPGTLKVRFIELNANVGHFFIDKLALGIRASANGAKHISETGYTEITQNNHIGAGPFVRYYFLPFDNRLNVFADFNGIYQINYTKDSNSPISFHNGTSYTAFAGAEVFFNSSVGLELMAGFYHFRDNNTKDQVPSFQLKMGFQIHLEKTE